VAEPLKAQFGASVVHRLAAEISAAYPQFDRKCFQIDAMKGFDELELLDRGRHLADVLRQHLPGDFTAAVNVLLSTLPEVRAAAGGMASFFYLPHTEFVARHGLNHFADAMRALHALTQMFTAEFALRPFLEHHQAETLRQLDAWTRDPSEHVRRMVSESTRTRLPWAGRLRAFQRDPAPVLALLETLRDDPSLYVRRSVANNLNDIGKDHPALLVSTMTQWLHGASEDRRWIVQHALRYLIKHGDRAALGVLGHAGRSTILVTAHTISPKRPAMGSRVAITCTLQNPARASQRAVVDLRVHFRKADGATRAKVFKLSTVELARGEQVTLRKTVSLADLTTRRHYPGLHSIELQINGSVTLLGTFTLRPTQ
jgi:3-methyladenine DNA glycosylase AlkC